MLKVCPEYINDLFRNWNVFYSCHISILSTWFLLGSTEVLAALPRLQKVVDLGHSVQLSVHSFSLQFYVVFSFRSIQYRIIAGKFPVVVSCILHHNDCLMEGLACGFQLPPSDNISPKGTLASTPLQCGMIENMLRASFERSAYFECVSSSWGHQLVILGNQNVLLISMGLEW